MGFHNVGIGPVLLPQDSLEFILVAILGSGEGRLKSDIITNEVGRKEAPASQNDPFWKRGNNLELCEKVFFIGKSREGWR